MNSPDAMQDMNLTIKNEDPEAQMRDYYNRFREVKDESYSRIAQNKKSTDGEPKKGWGSYNPKGFNSSGYQTSDGNYGFTIGQKSGDVPPVNFSIPASDKFPNKIGNVRVSEIVYKNNQWMVRGKAYKKGWTELNESEKEKYETSSNYYKELAGDDVEFPATANVRSKIRDVTGISTDYEKHFSDLESQNLVTRDENTEDIEYADPFKEDVVIPKKSFINKIGFGSVDKVEMMHGGKKRKAGDKWSYGGNSYELDQEKGLLVNGKTQDNSYGI